MGESRTSDAMDKYQLAHLPLEEQTRRAAQEFCEFVDGELEHTYEGSSRVFNTRPTIAQDPKADIGLSWQNEDYLLKLKIQPKKRTAEVALFEKSSPEEPLDEGIVQIVEGENLQRIYLREKRIISQGFYGIAGAALAGAAIINFQDVNLDNFPQYFVSALPLYFASIVTFLLAGAKARQAIEERFPEGKFIEWIE